MKRLIIILALLPFAVFGQTKNVLKGISTNALTEPLVVPTGKSITIDSGATITNNGTATGFGDGSVTSVALTMPSIFSVSGSPITTSGTLAASLATQSANLVFAGPATGSAAAPTFRSLVAADIPDLSGTYQPLSSTLTTLSSATAAGLALMDDADATAQRATLGLGAAALLATSTGGNSTADAGKLAVFDADGILRSTLVINVYNAAGTRYGQLTPSALALSTGADFFAILRAPQNESTYDVYLPTTAGTLVGTGDTGTVTNDMLAGSIALSKITITGTPDGTKFLRDDGSWQSAGGGLTIGGTAISKVLTATATLDFADQAPSSQEDLTITVTGAAEGDPVIIGAPAAAHTTNVMFQAWVSSSDTVTVRFTHNDAVGNHNPDSGTFRVTIIQH